MNKTTTGIKTQNLKPTVVKEENVELVRKVKAMTPPVREELVTEIEAKIKSGAYDVPAETLASDIIKHLGTPE